MVARRPELWLLDEPHAGLDSAGRDLVDDLVGDARRSGVTVLVASHELERAAGLAGREIVLAGGTVLPPDPGTLADPATVEGTGVR